MSPKRALQKNYQSKLDQARTALSSTSKDSDKYGYWLGQVEEYSRKLENL